MSNLNLIPKYLNPYNLLLIECNSNCLYNIGSNYITFCNICEIKINKLKKEGFWKW